MTRGAPLPLKDQDRTRWDAAAINQGVELVGHALRRTPDRPDGYVVQAAIAACHALAPSYEETNWDAVISWYDVLLSLRDAPVVRLNRAAAVAERDGAEAGLCPGGGDRWPGDLPVVARDPGRTPAAYGAARGGACGVRERGRPRDERAAGRTTAIPGRRAGITTVQLCKRTVVDTVDPCQSLKTS